MFVILTVTRTPAIRIPGWSEQFGVNNNPVFPTENIRKTHYYYYYHYYYYFHYHLHHHHISVMELDHLLTRSGLTYPEVSSKSAMIPSASWGIGSHYPGKYITRHSIYTLYPISLVFQ